MRENGAIIWKECLAKVRHKNVHKSINQSVNDFWRHGIVMDRYKCPHCSGWHLATPIRAREKDYGRQARNY